jgi:hypothetical protein
LEIDLNQAHEYLSIEDDSNASNTSVSVITKIRGHELAGRTLRDAGCCAHATFHYGMAWILSYSLKNELDDCCHGEEEDRLDVGDEVARAVGDYAQMVELAGYPEIAILSLLFYHCGGTLDLEYENGHGLHRSQMNKNVQEKIISLFPLGMNCGCGFDECGASECFVAKQMIDSTIFKALLADIDDLDDYYLSKRFLRNAKESICAADILEVISKSTTRMRRESQMDVVEHDCNHLSTPSHIPSSLRFWSNAGPRELSPLLKILALKILYSSAISSSSFLYLACESLRHLAISLPLTSSLGRRMAITHKSHWAFYVFIHKLVLGEKVKMHRREVIPYHVPVWDIVSCLDQRKFHRRCSARAVVAPSTIPTHDSTSMERNVVSLGKHLKNVTAHLCQQGIRINDDARTVVELPFPRCLLESSHDENTGVMYVIGDSHVLSLAWQTICISNNCHHFYRTMVPATITGLKAWHTRKDTHFFTKYNLDCCLERLPKICQTIILSAGEIDCREGIGGSLLQGYQDECDDAVRNTVVQYVASVQILASKYRLQVLLLPVAPHAHRSHKNGKSLGRGLRRRRMLLWNDTLREVCANIDNERRNVFFLDYEVGLREESEESPVGFVLNKYYNADYTHMNSAFLPLLEKSIVDCNCDLSLF